MYLTDKYQTRRDKKKALTLASSTTSSNNDEKSSLITNQPQTTTYGSQYATTQRQRSIVDEKNDGLRVGVQERGHPALRRRSFDSAAETEVGEASDSEGEKGEKRAVRSKQ